jgi:hypothetical protein
MDEADPFFALKQVFFLYHEQQDFQKTTSINHASFLFSSSRLKNFYYTLIP